jgi:general secretion pathway protein D
MSSTIIASLLSTALLLGGGETSEPTSNQAPVTRMEAQADAGKMVQVIYNVADLVVPLTQAPCEPEEGTAKPNCLPSGPRPEAGQTLEERLMRLVRTTIEPTSWVDVGGKGTIQYFPLGMALVVNQTRDVQEQIADLLTALRHLQDVEVAVEIQLISVSAEFLQRLGTDLKITFDPLGAVKDGAPVVKVTKNEGNGLSKFKDMAFIDANQRRQFMEAAQSERSTDTLQAPKLTVFNGQRAALAITDEHSFVTDLIVVKQENQVVVVPKNECITTGIRFQVQPVVSADRRFVVMNLQAKLTDLETDVPVVPVTTHLKTTVDEDGNVEVVPVQQFVQQPKVHTMNLRKSFQVADGKTAIICWGTRMEDVRTTLSCGVPVLDQVPLLNRLFTNVGCGREPRTVLLLVTPRVIINEQ